MNELTVTAEDILAEKSDVAKPAGVLRAALCVAALMPRQRAFGCVRLATRTARESTAFGRRCHGGL